MTSKMVINIDPTGTFKGIKEKRLLESTGLLKHFALDVFYCAPETVEEAFEELMECYGYGMGQDGTGWGTVDDSGYYISEADADTDMAPLVTFELGNDIQFNVYQYAICAVTDSKTTLMMRMD